MMGANCRAPTTRGTVTQMFSAQMLVHITALAWCSSPRPPPWSGHPALPSSRYSLSPCATPPQASILPFLCLSLCPPLALFPVLVADAWRGVLLFAGDSQIHHCTPTLILNPKSVYAPSCPLARGITAWTLKTQGIQS